MTEHLAQISRTTEKDRYGIVVMDGLELVTTTLSR